jgi:hypothetical protein
MTLLTLCVTAPAQAQLAKIVLPQPTQMTPDIVVARLMSFDTNHDGKVARAELPERMQPLLSRGNVNDDDALDSTELRRLAETPPPVVNARGVQPGRYGFIDEGFGFDSKLHIDGALEDLRLAGATREKAFGIAKAFQEGRNDRANADLLATMTRLLKPAQLAEFKDALEHKPGDVPAIRVGGVTFFGATPLEAAGQPKVFTRIRANSFQPARVIQQAELSDATRKEAMEAIEEYQARISGRLVDADRHALLDQLRGVLDDQQRDDLRAALERRPLAKQSPVPLVTTFIETVRPQQPAPNFQIQNLLLTR